MVSNPLVEIALTRRIAGARRVLALLRRDGVDVVTVWQPRADRISAPVRRRVAHVPRRTQDLDILSRGDSFGLEIQSLQVRKKQSINKSKCNKSSIRLK